MFSNARLALLLILSTGLAACATGPGFDTGNTVDVAPARAVADIDRYQGQAVVWGGTILQTRNLEDRTRIEVLGYPLDRQQQPRTGAQAQGRFLVEFPGYLESADYASGRQITVTGRIEEARTGRVGEAEYRYPLVRADQLHLWEPEAQRQQQRPRFSFGVGVMLGR